MAATEMIVTPKTARALERVAKARDKIDRATEARKRYNHERDTAILAAIQTGATLRIVAKFAGVTHETVRAAAHRAAAEAAEEQPV